MHESRNVTILGNYVAPETCDSECTLTFTLKAVHIERTKLWKSKDISAEFFGNFWNNLLDMEEIKSKLHYICAELLENAVAHGSNSSYRITVHLCLMTREMMVYVKNRAPTDEMETFKVLVSQVLESDDLQKLFIEKIREARKAKGKKSQVGLITLIKDRGAQLSWRLEEQEDFTRVTTLARIPLQNRMAI